MNTTTSLFCRFLFVSVCLGFGVLVPNANGQVTSAAIRELTEFVAKKFSKEVAEEGVEVVSRKIETVVAQLGDEAVDAIRAVGPKAIRWIEASASDGAQSARLISRFGDEAAWVVTDPARRAIAVKMGDDAAAAMIKLGQPAEKILELGGESAAKAAAQLSTKTGRQLAMLADDSASAALVKNDALMQTVAKFGDKGMEFIWKNKASLAVAATLTAFLANPEPFIDGTQSLAQVVADAAVEPIAREIASSTNWTLTIGLLVLALCAYLLIKHWITQPRRMAK